MSDPSPIARLQRRLLELGCPPKATRRIVRETAEHYEDLQRAALAQGATPEQAVAQATEQLGDPQQLAERHVEVLRNSSWFARYAIVTFGIIPGAAMLGLGLFCLYFGGSRFIWSDPWGFFRTHAVWAFPCMKGLLWGSVLMATAALALGFCWCAQRCGVKRRWMWVAAGVLVAHGLFVQIQPTYWAMLSRGVELKQVQIAPREKRFIMQFGNLNVNESGPFSLIRQGQSKESDIIALVKPEIVAANPGLPLLNEPLLQHQVLTSLAEIRGNLVRNPPTAIWNMGWGSNWNVSDRNFSSGKQSFTSLIAYADNSGHLQWVAQVGLPFQNYDIFYSPAVFTGGWLHWFTVFLPLGMVAMMQGWQRRKINRLLQDEDGSPKGPTPIPA